LFLQLEGEKKGKKKRGGFLASLEKKEATYRVRSSVRLLRKGKEKKKGGCIVAYPRSFQRGEGEGRGAFSHAHDSHPREKCQPSRSSKARAGALERGLKKGRNTLLCRKKKRREDPRLKDRISAKEGKGCANLAGMRGMGGGKASSLFSNTGN